MSVKKQTAFRLNNEIIEYLNQYKEENNLSSVTKALEVIVSEHKSANMNKEELIAKRVIDLFDSKYGNALTRIRLATRTSDINSQVMLEAMKSILYSANFPLSFVPTDVMKNEIIEKSEEKVKARIAYYKQLKDNKNNKKREG